MLHNIYTLKLITQILQLSSNPVGDPLGYHRSYLTNLSIAMFFIYLLPPSVSLSF